MFLLSFLSLFLGDGGGVGGGGGAVAMDGFSLFSILFLIYR